MLTSLIPVILMFVGIPSALGTLGFAGNRKWGAAAFSLALFVLVLVFAVYAQHVEPTVEVK